MSHVAPPVPSAEAHRESTAQFGFWMYLMTDCILFGSLFATYAVLRNNTFGSVGGAEIFNLPLVLVETIILLTSSFLCGLALLSARQHNVKQTVGLLVATAALGIGFLGIELYEFATLVSEGYSWTTSAFLSSFFALVGTHGAHITVGLLWMIVMIVKLLKQGATTGNVRRLGLLALFWHFLDVVWIFIFTVVYLLGVSA